MHISLRVMPQKAGGEGRWRGELTLQPKLQITR